MNKAILFLVIIGAATACTTTKKRGEASGLSKFYHNTTAKYNGFFNANELMQASILQLEDQQKDNYTKLLDMYEYIGANNPQAVAPQLDTAIKKVSVVVNLHRQSHWTDDCYLLVGKAQYLKKDYESAEATLRYTVNEFSPEAKLKKSKKDNTASANKKTSDNAQLSARQRKKQQEKVRKERAQRAKEIKRERERYNKEVKKARKKGIKPPPRPGSAAKDSTAIKAEEAAKKAAAEKEKQDAAKKQKPEDPDSYFLKHRPTYHESVLWLAKTYVERDNFEGAQRLINQLEQDPTTFEDIRAELPALQAYLLLKQKKYSEAITPLEKAVDVTADRKNKARYAYVLAQLYQMQGRNDAAYVSFDRVLKFSNDYEMEFSARLNMAQNAWASGAGSAEDARQNLQKMLKDEKNKEYLDQVYFALANIALKSGDRQGAIENLKLSIDNSSQNVAQKAETYLTLADLYYEDEDFVNAKKHYDNALNVLPNTDERYEEVRRLSNSLVDIAKNLEIIALQDSLLRISALSPDEKRKLAADIKKRQEEQRAAAATQATNTPGKKNVAEAKTIALGPSTAPALQKESTFFAYNDRLVKQGKRDFSRKWGDRKLEDNWRRSNKQAFSDGAESGDSIAQSAPVATVSDSEMDRLLGNIPKTDSEKKVVELKIREAMFVLGSLYRDRLQKNEKAAAILEEMNSRFPESNFELDSWYLLYLIYTDMGNASKANEYKEKIIKNYEQSPYAKVLLDPSHIAAMRDEKMQLSFAYDEAYAAFLNGNFQDAVDKIAKAREKFGTNNALQPKFALLNAMCLGNLKGKETYVNAMTEVVAKYPNTEEQKYAREALRLLGASAGMLPGDQKIEATQFAKEDDQIHSVVIALSPDASTTDCKNAVSNFNTKYHNLDKLRISDVLLINGEIKTPLIVIRRFKDKAEAMKYYDGIQKNKADFIPEKFKYEIYPISQGNYGKLVGSVKDVGAYRAFFEANYLK